MGTSDKHLKAASLYGYDGAASDGERFRLNEDLISRALVRLLEAEDTPYLICGNFNINPQQSPAITGRINRGILVDVPCACELREQHTFSTNANGPPQQGVEGKGRARIDTVLANKAAFPLIKECKIRWGLFISDHAPIEVVMDVQRYGAKITTPKMQHHFPEIKWAAENRKGKEKERGEAWQKVWNSVNRKFNKAEDQSDIPHRGA